MKKRTVKYTTEVIKREAARFDCKSEFFAQSRGAYRAMFRLKLEKESCAHMKSPRWNKQAILDEAKTYTSRSEFQKKSRTAYDAARRLEILDDACTHMRPKQRKWTFDDLQCEAAKYRHRWDFAQKSTSAYQTARHRNCLDQICAHMPRKVREPIYTAVGRGNREKNTEHDYVAAKLRRLMQDNNVSQSALARATGIPQPTINRILNRATLEAKFSSVILFAKFFKISTESFCESSYKC